MLNVDQTQNNPLGTFSDKFPKVFSSAVKFFGKQVLTYEAKKIRMREEILATHFKSISFTSSLEAEEFERLYKNKESNFKCFSNPPCINSQRNIVPFVKKNDFIFVGNMKSNHNLACLKNIKEIIDILKENGTTLEIKVYGDFDSRAASMCKNYDSLQLIGPVEDLNKILTESRYLIAPFEFGTGIKIKIIEAMSSKLLVITNSIGKEGIPIENKKHFLECEGNVSFGNTLYDIVNHGLPEYNEMVDSAFYLVDSIYSEKKVENNFINFIES